MFRRKKRSKLKRMKAIALFLADQSRRYFELINSRTLQNLCFCLGGKNASVAKMGLPPKVIKEMAGLWEMVGEPEKLDEYMRAQGEFCAILY